MPDVRSSPFAEFAAGALTAQFPARARQMAVDAISDSVGCQLLGAREPIADMLLATLAWSETPHPALPVALLGRQGFASPTDAALFGGTLTHALDYDDTNHPAYAHPSAVLVPAMLAVSAVEEAKGSDIVSAYIAGFELFGKLGRALNTSHYEHGWHATKTFGALAAALSASIVLRLDAALIETALAIAASSASGMRANFGTMVKPLHAGQAAQAGVSAALLAQQGFSANRGIFEHRYGYLALMAGAAGYDSAPFEFPGESLEILTSEGLALKPYPSCGATHPAIESALAVRQRLNGRTIRSVRVGASRLSFSPLIYDRPETPLQAKFSMQFCVATALAKGRLGLPSFSIDAIRDPEIVRIMDAMTVAEDPCVANSLEFAAVITVETDSGEQISETVHLAKGKPSRWFSEAEMRTKFVDCATAVTGPAAATALFDRLRALDTATPVRWFFRVQPDEDSVSVG